MRFSSIFPLLTAILPGIFLSGAEKPATIGSPYGICAHLNRWEFDRMPQELELMKQAGIRHVRTDLDWNRVEKIKGSWNFERWDALVKEAEKQGISILPILGGTQPRWGSPLVKHMDTDHSSKSLTGRSKMQNPAQSSRPAALRTSPFPILKGC